MNSVSLGLTLSINFISARDYQIRLGHCKLDSNQIFSMFPDEVSDVAVCRYLVRTMWRETSQIQYKITRLVESGKCIFFEAEIRFQLEATF